MSLIELLLILGAVAFLLAMFQVTVTRPSRTYAWDFWVATGLLLWVLTVILAHFGVGTGNL